MIATTFTPGNRAGRWRRAAIPVFAEMAGIEMQPPAPTWALADARPAELAWPACYARRPVPMLQAPRSVAEASASAGAAGAGAAGASTAGWALETVISYHRPPEKVQPLPFACPAAVSPTADAQSCHNGAMIVKHFRFDPKRTWPVTFDLIPQKGAVPGGGRYTR